MISYQLLMKLGTLKSHATLFGSADVHCYCGPLACNAGGGGGGGEVEKKSGG